MLTSARRAAAIIAAAAALPASFLVVGAIAGTAAAAAVPHRTAPAPAYQARVILNGADLRHRFIPAGKSARTRPAAPSTW